jgi:hypothetical protein
MHGEQTVHFFLACERMVSACIVETQRNKRKKQNTFAVEYGVSMFGDMRHIFSKD